MTCKNSKNDVEMFQETLNQPNLLDHLDISYTSVLEPVRRGDTSVINYHMQEIQSPTATFFWADVPGSIFSRNVNSAYEEVVHWRRNLFLLPFGKVGEAFLCELAKLLHSYANQSTYDSIALKASFLMQVLLLQKPTKTSKAKDMPAKMARTLEER